MHPRRFIAATSPAVALALLAAACEPQVVVGNWQCPGPKAVDGGTSSLDDQVIASPWSTGFESGFCDYMRARGFCFSDPNATFEIADTQAHSGHHAAVFTITSDPSKDGAQARCFLEGIMPKYASYEAWFYLPTRATSTGNWNLMHLPSGTPDSWHGVWDVSLQSASDGTVSLYLFDILRGIARTQASPRPIPIGSWFHVEIHLLRAKDATGKVALYQDGALLLELNDLITDDADFGQWYVGNLAESITPPDSVLYVDDVAIRPVL